MKANQRMGQGIAREEIRLAREEQKTERLRIKTEGAIAKEEAKGAKEEAKGNVFAKKLQAKKEAEKRARLNKFASKVESKSVQGIIPPIENRGMHNMVTFNPFSSPEKEVERDPRTGLLHVRNGIWGN